MRIGTYFVLLLERPWPHKVIPTANKAGVIFSIAPASASPTALADRDTFQVIKIKEKFGTLRFYWRGKLSDVSRQKGRGSH
jgi:hypothetical protein